MAVWSDMSDMVQKAPEATQIADTGAWLAYFNDEIHDYEEGTADRDFPELFKSLLNAGSTDDLALNDYLRRFDELDRKSSLTYEPLETLLTLGRIMPYDDSKQDVIMKVLEGLIKQPHAEEARSFHQASGAPLSESPQILSKQCEEWLSLSAFKARTLNAGICAEADEDFKAPRIDIPMGLELKSDSGKIADTSDAKLLRDCKLMVSAQYILIGGGKIKGNIEACRYKGTWDDGSWKAWTWRFLEAASWDDVQETTKVASKDAHNKMVELWPELFSNEGKHAPMESDDVSVEAE
ncbi:unnamed protein product [Discula destructiva]